MELLVSTSTTRLAPAFSEEEVEDSEDITSFNPCKVEYMSNGGQDGRSTGSEADNLEQELHQQQRISCNMNVSHDHSPWLEAGASLLATGGTENYATDLCRSPPSILASDVDETLLGLSQAATVQTAAKYLPSSPEFLGFWSAMSSSG